MPGTALPYRYLFLDWAGTLSTSHFWEQFRDPRHPQHDIYRHAQAALFSPEGDRALLDAWLHGRVTSEQVVSALFALDQFDPPVVLRELRRSCEQMRFVSPALPAYIRRIRAHGVRVVIATDNMDTFSRWTVPAMGLARLVDGWLNSADLGCTKAETNAHGHSIFFGPFLRGHHIEPGESLLIDDNRDPMFGACMRRCGVDYVGIQPGTGLLPELERILAALGSTL